MKKAYLYVKYNNIVVLKDYMDVIRDALEDNGYITKYIESMYGIEKDAVVVFPMAKDAFKYYLRGYKKIIIWQQGVTAEESYLRNHSRIRFCILNFIDCYMMKKAKIILYVSAELRSYYERRAKVSFWEKSVEMPCFNDHYDIDVLNHKDYSIKTLAYVGSLDLWQCFEKTVETFKAIEESEPKAFFKVLTFQAEQAEKILKEHGIKNYVVKSVPKNEVRQELKDVSFGFIIRENITVNQVATPTKFSAYLAAGVLPIYSDCLSNFKQNNQKYDVSMDISDQTSIGDILDFINRPRDTQQISKRIISLFDNYYCVDRYCDKLKKKIGENI